MVNGFLNFLDVTLKGLKLKLVLFLLILSSGNQVYELIPFSQKLSLFLSKPVKLDLNILELKVKEKVFNSPLLCLFFF
jgi:hypothetical protein